MSTATLMTRDELATALQRQLACTRETALELADRARARCTPSAIEPVPNGARATRLPADADADVEACGGLFQRIDDWTLRLVLALPPRTKKNGTTLGIRQSKQFRRYRARILAFLRPHHDPDADEPLLPDGQYNLAATYYVDGRGANADLVGLHQALLDILENAGVVRDDWQFRALDGSRVVQGDAHPRVELTITPLREPAR